jgi:hypothetical protein
LLCMPAAMLVKALAIALQRPPVVTNVALLACMLACTSRLSIASLQNKNKSKNVQRWVTSCFLSDVSRLTSCSRWGASRTSPFSQAEHDLAWNAAMCNKWSSLQRRQPHGAVLSSTLTARTQPQLATRRCALEFSCRVPDVNLAFCMLRPCSAHCSLSAQDRSSAASANRCSALQDMLMYVHCFAGCRRRTRRQQRQQRGS